MRAIWKGSISFGLVSIPVQVFPATEEKSISFHQLHARDGGRIHHQRVCSICGEEVPLPDIVRGYEVEPDRYVTVTDDDLASLPLPSRRVIEIACFVDAAEIDPVYFQRAYFVTPEETGAKAYHLLREVLHATPRLAVAKVALRDKEHLAALRLRDDVLMLHTMYWPDEIRPAAFALPGPTSAEARAEAGAPAAHGDTPALGGAARAPAPEIRPAELEMAKLFVDSLTEPWDPGAFSDRYREALMELLDRKARGEVITPAAAPPEAEVVDMLAALRASVAAAKAKREAAAG